MSETLRNKLAEIPKAWPFEEARKVAARLAASGKDHALFETGYGPSGLPHIGTFGEVARTTWVRNAFTEMTGHAVQAAGVQRRHGWAAQGAGQYPEPDMLTPYLGKPLTQIPDPFGTHDSFGAHNNARLRAFLDSFGFEYEFASSTDYYKAGRFDAALVRMLECYDAGHGGDPADARAGPPRHLFADPADPPAYRHRHAGADGADRPRRRHSDLDRSRHR